MSYEFDLLATAHPLTTSDLYHWTMGDLFYKNGDHNTVVTFEGYMRENPGRGAYSVAAGQGIVIDRLRKFTMLDDHGAVRFKPVQENFKQSLIDAGISQEYIQYIETAPLELTINIVPEGELIHPNEPIYQVTGPLHQAQMMETLILNSCSAQMPYATVGSQMIDAMTPYVIKEGDESREKIALAAEFGLRRANSINGYEGSRAAYIAGFDATSNTGAGAAYGIPLVGTVAHLFVMMYGDDETAVAKYLRANPEQALYLVDTYDSINGINTFCEKCKELGVKPKGIRLDSGDISKLSHQARQILNDYGFGDALIVVSDGLDKHDIMRHILNDDPIGSFGVGSRLVSPKMDPMNIVYKLCAVHNGRSMQEIHALMEEARKQGGPPPYRPEMKVSEVVGKSSLPGVHQILRLYDENKGAYRGDLVVFDHEVDVLTSQDTDGTLRLGNDIKGISRAGDRVIYPTENTVVEIPLTTVFNNGQFVGDRETIRDARQRLKNQRDKLPRQVRAICDPTDYPVHLSEDLHTAWQTGLTT